MDKRKGAAFFLGMWMITMDGSSALAEAQYVARDKSGQIVKQGTTVENEEFTTFDGLEYEFNGEHRTNQGANTAGYVFGNGTKVYIDGNIVNLKEGTAIEAEEQTSARINGNVYGDVRNFDSTIEIHGNIESESWLGAVFALGEVGNKANYKTQTTINGNVKSSENGVYAQDGAHIKIAGNIEAGGDGVTVGDPNDAEIDGAAVEVQGKIEAQKNGIVVYQPNPKTNRWNDTLCVNVRGDVQGEGAGIDTYGDVLVNGNVTGGWNGVVLEGKAEVQVMGDVAATKKEIDYTDVDYYHDYGEWRMYCGDAIRSFEDAAGCENRRLKVMGNVLATGDGIIAECGKIDIDGNVRSEYENCVAMLDALPISVVISGNVEGNTRRSAVFLQTSAENKMIVQGKVRARGKQSAVELYDLNFDYDQNQALARIPLMIMKAIDVEDGVYFKAGVHHSGQEEWLDEDAKGLAEAAAKAVWYIVDVNQTQNGQVEVDGTSIKEGFLVAREGDRLTVSGTPKKGYRLVDVDAGSKALVTRNMDGTYTVLVNRGGDLTLSGRFEAMPDMPQTGDQTPINKIWMTFVGAVVLLTVLWKKKACE